MSFVPSSSRGVLALSCAALWLAACGRDPAPADLDGSLQWLYANYAVAEPAELADAVIKLNASLDFEAMPIRNELTTKLPVTALIDVELRQTNDPSTAQGMLVSTVIPCALADVEKLYIATNQNEIHGGGYESYTRAHTSSSEDFLARRTDRLTWKTDYVIDVVGSRYSATILGGARFVTADGDAAKFPFGSFLLGRAVLPAPAIFDADDADNDFFKQDYQLDIYYQRAPKETVHVFGLWRDLRIGIFSASDDTLISQVTQASVDGDQDVADLCNK